MLKTIKIVKTLMFMVIYFITVKAHGQIQFINSGSYKEDTTTIIDVDAQRFLDSAGIQETTIIRATPLLTGLTLKKYLNRLVLDLKGKPNPNYFTVNLWDTIIKAAYPMIGGTSLSHRLNLRNPVNADTAFRLTFFGTPIHNSEGINFDSAGYAYTHLFPAATLSIYSVSLGAFRASTGIAPYDIAAGGYGAHGLALYGNITSVRALSYSTAGSGPGLISFPNTVSKGLYIMSRNAADNFFLMKNGKVLTTKTTAGGTMPTQQLTLAANWSDIGVELGGGNKCTYTFFIIGKGMSQYEAIALNNAIETFNKAIR